MSRPAALITAGALVLCLLAGSDHALVGDGGEYVAQAINFASFHGPSIGVARVPAIKEQLTRFDPGLADWDIEHVLVRSPRGGGDFVHFWFYALLATPALWITNAADVQPTIAFTAVNLLLFGLAFWIAWPRLGAPACVLLFAGPIVWWLDKAHTEVFTASLLTIAFALLGERPVWAAIAAAAAATQNPPIAVLPALIAGAAVIDEPARLRNPRFLSGIGVAAALAALHPVYAYVRHGTPSLLLTATRDGVPTAAEFWAVVFDPDIGLIGNTPALLLTVAIAAAVVTRRRPRAWLSTDLAVAVLSAVVFLFSFARTANMHHGATPSLSRYALWLVPLSLPLVRHAGELGRNVWRRLLWPLAVLSAVVSIVAFHPGTPENTREPTWLAEWLWTKHPSWNNPLPEVFMEANLRVDRPFAPVTSGRCEKILVAGGDADGLWPLPCYPVDIPEWCRRSGTICYANLNDRAYTFVRAPGRPGAPPERRIGVWPLAALEGGRHIFDEWNSWTMPVQPDGLSALRRPIDVDAWAIGTEERFMLALRHFGSAPVLHFRLPSPMSGALYDADTGQRVQVVRYDGPARELWELRLPRDFTTLILALRLEPAR